jgi:hypothetical protein
MGSFVLATAAFRGIEIVPLSDVTDELITAPRHP